MKKVLVVVDMQNDFISGSLGTEEARQIVGNVAEKILAFDGSIFATMDTHEDADYLLSEEGKNLPVKHCLTGTGGYEIDPAVKAALEQKNAVMVTKYTFGSKDLPDIIADTVKDDIECIELVGLCTDVCVISNAIILKAFFRNTPIYVDAACCAGVTPQSHKNALEAMKSCQIHILND